MEFIVDDEFYAENKAYLNEELNKVQEGKATYLTLKELEDELNKVIKKNEDRL